jgi:amino acid transporter
MPSLLKQVLLGRPLATEQAKHQRLGKTVALAVFSSDALSSVAYATEEILLALVVAGTAALTLALPVSLAIAVLLVVVATSYRQTIKAYPSGGGAYIVAKDNLGETPGLIAGAALLVDYVLTVAVSVSAGTAAVTSAFPMLSPYRTWIALAFVVLLALANLRGVRESGALFAGPTYFFVGSLALLIVAGLYRYATGGTIPVQPHELAITRDLTLFIVLRAFASGCAAMTGVEAISNGVQAFKEPSAHNARMTLTWMAGILAFLFLGISALATLSGVRPAEETIVSQLARGVFGAGPFYYLLQAATAAILVLAANTSYADFPRLGSFMASDGYLPSQLKSRGDRLVYSNGVLLLTVLAAALIALFAGDTHRLIPLYAVGVFTSFTLSQAGMVVHWVRVKEPGWQWSIAVNAFGAATTLVVLVVIALAKFQAGAWVVVLLIPLLVSYFKGIHTHYASVKRRLALPESGCEELHPLHNNVVLLVSGVHRGLIRAVQYAKSLKAETLQAVFIDVTGDKAVQVSAEWEACDFGIPLTVIGSPYRELVEPLKEHIREIPRITPDDVVTVILPEYVPEHIVDFALHDQTAFRIKSALFLERGVIVADVPYHLG